MYSFVVKKLASLTRWGYSQVPAMLVMLWEMVSDSMGNLVVKAS
jgi:hypothetical protein